MKCGILFSGGKDSTYAAFLTKKYGYEITSLITIISENPDSYMFHTPSILKVKKQSVLMNIPLITQNTTGIKEKELKDLEKVIQKSIKQFNIDSIVTGTVESAYQSSRIQKICDKLGLDCFNPLWQKNQIDLLYELVENKFITIIVGVFAYPFDKKWLGNSSINRKIQNKSSRRGRRI